MLETIIFSAVEGQENKFHNIQFQQLTFENLLWYQIYSLAVLVIWRSCFQGVPSIHSRIVFYCPVYAFK